jgi:hypothetical protein
VLSLAFLALTVFSLYLLSAATTEVSAPTADKGTYGDLSSVVNDDSTII